MRRETRIAQRQERFLAQQKERRLRKMKSNSQPGAKTLCPLGADAAAIDGKSRRCGSQTVAAVEQQDSSHV